MAALDVEALLTTPTLPIVAEVYRVAGVNALTKWYADVSGALDQVVNDIALYSKMRGPQFDPSIAIDQIERLKLCNVLVTQQRYFLDQIRDRLAINLRRVWWQ